MRRGSSFSILIIGFLVAAFCVFPGVRGARAQAGADAALRDRVLQLVDRLDTEKAEAREAATASLIKLGPNILSLLPDPATVTSTERKDRLVRIRAALLDKAAELNTGASRVTITGKGIRLSEALQQLQKQTGNAITDIREQLGAEVTNPALDLDVRDKPFFEALDEIARLAEVSTSYATGDGTIGIMAGASMTAAPGTPAQGNPLDPVQWTVPDRAAAVEPISRFPGRDRCRQHSA